MPARPCNVGGTKHTRKGVRSGNLEEARSEPEWGGDVRGATELQNPKTAKRRSIDLGMPG